MTQEQFQAFEPPQRPQKSGAGKVAAFVSIAAVAGLLIGGGAGYAIGAANAPQEASTAATAPPAAPPAEEAEKETEETDAPTPTVPDRKESERGNLIKNVGEQAGLGNKNADEVLFTVTGITLNPECTGDYPLEPKNGHFLKLDIEVESTPQAMGDFSFSFWKWIRPDGTTANVDPGQDGNGYTCLSPADSLPHSIGPAEKVSGSIVLDVPDAEGTLIAQPSYAGTTGSWYWEWAVPAE